MERIMISNSSTFSLYTIDIVSAVNIQGKDDAVLGDSDAKHTPTGY